MNLFDHLIKLVIILVIIFKLYKLNTKDAKIKIYLK